MSDNIILYDLYKQQKEQIEYLTATIKGINKSIEYEQARTMITNEAIITLIKELKKFNIDIDHYDFRSDNITDKEIEVLKRISSNQ